MLVLVLFLAGAVASPGRPTPQGVLEALARASALMEEERFEPALAVLREALEAEPDEPEALRLAAEACLRLDRLPEALAHAESLAAHSAGGFEGLVLAGRIQERMGRLEDAAASYAGASADGRAGDRRSEPLRRLGALRMRAGDDGAAARAYERARALAPDDPRILTPLGILQARLGRFAESLDSLGRVLRLDAHSFEAHHYLGTVYSAMQEWSRALEHLDAALAVSPGNGLSLYEKALVFSGLEKRSDALALLEAARRAMPESGLVRFRIGEILEYENDPSGAETEFREALRLDATLTAARVALGRTLFEARRYQDAVAELERAVRRDPADPEGHHVLARVHEQRGRTEAARRHFERALELDPFRTNAYLHFGNFLVRLGDRDRGGELLRRFQELSASDKDIESLRRLVDFEPDDDHGKQLLLERLLEAGRHEAALRQARRFLASAPEEPQSHVNLAMVHLRMRRFSDARRSLESALDGRAESAELLGLLGDAQLGDGDREAARRSYERAAELDERSGEWSFKLGMLFLQQGLRSRARDAFERAVRNDPAHARAHNALGVIALDDGDIAESIAFLETAVEIEPALSSARRNLGEAYIRAGRREEGERELARADELDRVEK